MQTKHFVWISLTAMSLLAFTAAALAGAGGSHGHPEPAAALVETVRHATQRFQNVGQATAAGYANTLFCVSGPEEGAMGIHFVNGALIGDGELDPQRPEALIYEAKNGQLRLVAVEYIVIAEDWAASDPPTPTPVLLGQLLHYNGSPNRYGLPAFYELHVWAWKHNPNGMFTDWNPRVSCEEYAP